MLVSAKCDGCISSRKASTARNFAAAGRARRIMVCSICGSASHTKPSCDTEAGLVARLASDGAKLAAIRAKKELAKKEVAPAKKRRAAVDSASTTMPKKQKTAALTPTEIIDELVAINKLPYGLQEAAKRKRPECFEFSTNWHRSDREVRKKANQLLHGTPSMTKTKLCAACRISGVGLLNKFLDNKSRNCAEDSLSVLISILEGEAEGELKRRRRLQLLLKRGLAEPEVCIGIALGSRVYADPKWSPDKLKRFRKAFPGVDSEGA